jgi:hydroxypyruvate isomerase
VQHRQHFDQVAERRAVRRVGVPARAAVSVARLRSVPDDHGAGARLEEQRAQPLAGLPGDDDRVALDARAAAASLLHRAAESVERGRVSALYGTLLHSPPIADGWLHFLTAVRRESTLPAALREMVILRVAVLNGAPYEAAQHAPIAEREGIMLILEPMNIRVDHKGHCLYGSEAAVRICRAVGSKMVKINWDLYHCHISEGDLCGHLREGFDQLGYAQLADHPGRTEPGTGEIHYPRVLKELAALGYTGYVGVECNPSKPEREAAMGLWNADQW